MPVIRIDALNFNCIENFTVFFMLSSHYPVVEMFDFIFIVLKITLFIMSSSEQNVQLLFHCLCPLFFIL